ncbi:two-component system sensor histidine kinase VanS [Breznakia sp. PF5-3]|uniref:sensor histidine kinase n=1 Tax=unclassified Breznakia TaxID=2623764 RepID=UPI002405EFF3|nr:MULTISPECIES: HAMP domain-containing sensor histidine kinase [unclassified Breznakia]MDF9824806.1 two-component system sensor histidine kinase VanS [Breznakia sp. PM6-1]MDF9835738.1 two-component system sensor histidine kinase VanS [Breznakia sp. PF5-3]MDF9837824.1 two-component system sensor histidine kinase VanS [Breznakia sp. PFB2-8]MDF9859805.1 two-component system sensor histidine kinase VanS [Breznakia sp. PH5-24]
MKAKYRLWNSKILFRMFIVGLGSLIVCAIVGIFIREYLDNVIRTEIDAPKIYYDIFYFLSTYQLQVYILVFLAAFLIFSGWIIQPSLQEIAGIVKDNIQLDDKQEEIHLPSYLSDLEKELTQVNKEIQLWKYAAKDAEQRKDDLIVYLAHDIRTPLASVLGYLILLDENNELSDEQRQRFIKIALQKSEKIQTLVEELFEITRFNISQLELVKQDVNLYMLIQQMIEEYQANFEAKNIKVDIQAKKSTHVFADDEKLARAIENVLMNAIRYTPFDGEINVLIEEDEEKAMVRIENTGVEISESELERIFDKFYRGDEARQTKTGGSGLGLAIAKNIVESHGGKIIAKSQNQITSFILELPKK